MSIEIKRAFEREISKGSGHAGYLYSEPAQNDGRAGEPIVLSNASLVQARYPGIALTKDNLSLYEGWLDKELRIPRCADCGKWHQPSRSVCPFCWSFDVRPTAVTGRGEVYLSMVLAQGAAVDGVVYPYPIVLIDLEEQAGLRYTSTIIPRSDLVTPVGTKVELVWLERGGAPFPAFRAVDSRES